MDNNTSYETQAIDLNLLSMLDITKEGKVVSAEKWVELWNLVFQHINKIDAFCVDMQSTLDNWHESEIALNEIIEDMQMKYNALSTEFIHYGENTPENPHIMLWVRRMNDVSTHGFLTNEDVDSALSSTSENPVQNKVINTALSKKVDRETGKGLSTNDYTTPEKDKLSGIETGANKTVVDTALSDTSENPVQNKVVNTALNNKMDKNNPTGTGSFSLNRRANTTVGSNSHAEGYNAEASGSASHAEGGNTKASGSASHAEGGNTKASGSASHAEGWNTIAASDYQHAQGKYNISDSNNIYADIIGNGSSDTERSNAYTLDWNGNAWYAGDVYVGSASGTNKDAGSKKLATEEYADTQITEKTDQTYNQTSENAQSGKAVAEAIAQNTYTKISKIEISVDDFSQFDTSKVYIAANNIQVKYKKTSTAEFTTIDESTIYKNSLITFSSWIDTEYSTPEFLIIVSGRIISDNFVYCNAKYQFEDEVEGERFLAYEPLYFNPSPTDLRYFATSDNPQSGKAVAEAVSAEQNRADNTFANALKGTASGSAILIDDISPVTHNMGVKVRSKNLFDKDMPFTDDNKVTEGAASGYLTYFIQLQPNTKYYAKCFAPVTTDFSVTILSSNKAVNSEVFEAIILSKQLTGWETELVLTTDDTGRLYVGNNANNVNKIKEILSACNLQIELGATATDYTPYVPDLTAVKVSRYGKNLFDKNNANIIVGYPDAENVINPASTTKSVYIPCAPNTTYTVSKVVTARFAVAFTDVLPASGVAVTNKIQNNTATSITSASSANSRYIVVWIYHSNYDTSITVDEVLATLQIEQGSTATEYEPYKTSTEYTPTADGTVNGVTSLYPNTTLMTDTEGVLIDCEYNRDINKAFAELQQAIISLGGNV